MSLRIDAHHHLWRYTLHEFGWLEGDLLPLRRDFLADDLLAELTHAQVHGAVAVQARQTTEETLWLLEVAQSTPEILGVVGWLPIAAPDFASQLADFQQHRLLKGLRHVVQAEPAGFLDGDAFNRGIALLKDSGLVYDILIHHHQLAEALRFVDRHPNQRFVLDHIAKPRIAASELEPWATHIRALAQRPNITCKLSGMITEANPSTWTPAQLSPYLNTVLESFGPNRLMIGTDWPVLTVGCTYTQWWQTVEHWIAPLTQAEQSAILGGTAIQAYSLSPRVA